MRCIGIASQIRCDTDALHRLTDAMHRYCIAKTMRYRYRAIYRIVSHRFIVGVSGNARVVTNDNLE
ncbi:hypothetical protein PGT21_015582 [Puccinia graminis f. sp. tritici]|uniref:Uncharacterized protein n=1 Tax=Puccinia graminis f. sp. tritici TaxID=56615 RepID=A0A5B0R0M9_PUCGR|nr:hypothetical protein PGT21_015582 [Puccinia graminis f. sp. tritici]